MEYRFVEYQSKIYIVRGIGYYEFFNPPEVFYCQELKESVFRTLILETDIIIPVSEAKEITDKKRILAIWSLYGR